MAQTVSNKSGFGLLEVVASILVMAFTVLAINLLQLSNRETVLRIQQRNEASAIAQNVIDSLNAIGITSIYSTSSPFVVVGSPHRMKTTGTTYTKQYKVSIAAEPRFSSEKHIIAQKVDIVVSWKAKETNHSIKVSTVVQ